MIADILAEAGAALELVGALTGIARQLEESEIDREQAAQLRQAAHDRHDAALRSLAPDIARDRARRDAEIAARPATRPAPAPPPPAPGGGS